jgi:hypothetical protein
MQSTQNETRVPNFLLSGNGFLPNIFIPTPKGIDSPLLEGIERDATDPVHPSGSMAMRVRRQR